MVTTTRVFVASVIASIALLSGCAGQNATAEGSPSTATAAPAPSLTVGTGNSPAPQITSPTPTVTAPDPTAPAVDKVNVELGPEVGQVDSLDHDGANGTTKCADGYTTIDLKINGTISTPGESKKLTKIKTMVGNTTATITVDGKLLSVEGLVVNGTKGTALPADVGQARHSVITLPVRQWTKNGISKLAFCAGGSGLDAPVSTD